MFLWLDSVDVLPCLYSFVPVVYSICFNIKDKGVGMDGKSREGKEVCSNNIVKFVWVCCSIFS